MTDTRKPDNWAETLARKVVHSLPICYFGSTQAIQAFAQALRDAVAAERKACAEVAREEAKAFLSPQYAVGQPFSSLSERFACEEVAKAIEARGDKP